MPLKITITGAIFSALAMTLAPAAFAAVEVHGSPPTVSARITGADATTLYAALQVPVTTVLRYFDGCGAESCPPVPVSVKRVQSDGIDLICERDTAVCTYAGPSRSDSTITSRFGGQAAATVRSALGQITGGTSWVLSDSGGSTLGCGTTACTLLPRRLDSFASRTDRALSFVADSRTVRVTAQGSELAGALRLGGLRSEQLNVYCSTYTQACELHATGAVRFSSLNPVTARLSITGPSAGAVSRALGGTAYTSTDGTTRLSCSSATACQLVVRAA